MLVVTIRNDFFDVELTGEFESVEEAKENYAYELGTFEEDIEVVKVEEKK